MLILKNQLNADGGLEKQMFSICHALFKKQKITILTTKPKLKSKKNKVSVYNSNNSNNFNNPKKIPLLPKNIQLHFLEKLPLPNFLQLIYYNYQVKKYLKQHPQNCILGLDKSTHQTHLRMGLGLHSFFLRQRKSYESFFKKITLFLDPRHWTILWFEKKTLLNPRLKKIIVNSRMVFNQVISTYPSINPKKIAIVLNGIEWQKLQKPFNESFSKKPTFLKQLNLHENTHHFLFVGNGFKRKGLDLLLKALFLLKKENQDKEQDQAKSNDTHKDNNLDKNKNKHSDKQKNIPWHLSIVGKDKKHKFYLELTKKLVLDKNVSFFGSQNDMTAFYSMADTFVLPSYYDPFANTTLEALAMGLFTLTSPFNGGQEVIAKANGLVLKQMEEQELAELLKEALLRPKTLSSATPIRESIKHLEMDQQLEKFIKELN